MRGSMRGTSGATLAEVLDAVEAAKGPQGALGDELFSVTAVLDATPTLRRVLTDPASDADARSGLAAQLFTGKVGKDALAVIDVAVRGRWAAGMDLPDGLEQAGVAAHVAAADKDGHLDAMETELFEAGRIVDSDAELRRTLTDRTLAIPAKASLVDTLFDGKVSAPTLALLRQAAANRTGSFDRVLDTFADEVAERRSRLLAEVRVAYELGDAEKQRLATALAGKYGRDVHLNVVVDESIVGGISVSLGDDVIDGTVSSRLEDARRRIAG